MTKNIFEYAVENKLRFPYKGNVSAEDLYDLSVTELDSIYKTLKREAKKADEESLLEIKSNEDIVLSVKIEIIKHIVEKKLAQIDALKKAAENRKQKQKILSILAEKQDASLHEKSVEELEAMLADLG